MRGYYQRGVDPFQNFTAMLAQSRPARTNADPGMVVQPGVDPGYAMPNPDEGNVNQDNSQATGLLQAGAPVSLLARMLMKGGV